MKHILMIENGDGLRAEGSEMVHYDGPNGDFMLCGLAHDEHRGYPYSLPKETKKRITCDQCIQVRDHVLGRSAS